MKNERPPVIVRDNQLTELPPKTSRLVFSFLLLLSIAPSFLYYCLVDEGLEGLRVFGGLLPGFYLFLRWFGQLSACFPVVIVVALGWSFFRPAHTRQLLKFVAAGFLAFTVAFLCYALVVIYSLISSRSDNPVIVLRAGGFPVGVQSRH